MKIVKNISILVGTCLLAATMGLAHAQEANMKIATVNMQQVLQQSPRVASLSKKLESDFKNRQTKIGEEQKRLEDKVESFKKESPTMSAKDRDAMQKQISAERAELVKKVVAYQQDLQKEQNKIMQNIMDDVTGIVSKIAGSQNIGLVLDKQAVIYSGNSTDITKDVANQFNAKS